MSSAILYLAIVAIWACVLIPRWLRRDTSRAGTHPAGSKRPGAERAPGTMDAETEDKEEDAGTPDAGLGDHPEAETLDASLDDHGEAKAGEDESMVARPPDPRSRARVLAARRRMLMMLVGLTAAASGIVAVKLAAWWVTLPPAGMLAGYLMLLREARHVDAEHAQAVEQERELRRRARDLARRRERELVLRQEEAMAASVIDISERVKDELYDQYADTERRAVGD